MSIGNTRNRGDVSANLSKAGKDSVVSSNAQNDTG